jgi:hypothetical protein
MSRQKVRVRASRRARAHVRFIVMAESARRTLDEAQFLRRERIRVLEAQEQAKLTTTLMLMADPRLRKRRPR